MKRPQNYATIRLDEKLRDRIKALAQIEHRSFMGQVSALLEEALAHRDQAQPETLPRSSFGTTSQSGISLVEREARIARTGTALQKQPGRKR